ncbi:hypothetical protein PV08_10527 [Exophiala spinifera]|uniref:Sterol 3-beta-glucosyltransferase n=1 Tax=Exophiala spinifera TaxID=91928 RepID=A0A0D1ZDZ0_9EURO|nr:uncharacterized protein PV08_10527 [Exophiala spinifera]KIW11227.1 hypothetical protein PV08_10527 [Exophiala spinifera]
MASLEDTSRRRDTSQRTDGHKPQKRNPRFPRLPSPSMPSRLNLGADAHEDVTAPSRGRNAPAQYMNQSIFSMIAAAGSRTDFNARFDESSDSEEEAAQTKPSFVGSKETSVKERQTAPATEAKDDSPSFMKRSKYPSPDHLSENLPPSPARAPKPKDKDKASTPQPELSQESDSASDSGKSNPRDAPVLSRLLTAEAEFTEGDDHPPSMPPSETVPESVLATRLMEIFGFDAPEKVVAEYPCWLLQSVLLQGYLYITTNHICFYAYLQRKSHNVTKIGYLEKKGRTTSKYKRYWFSLKGDVLSYYSDPSNLYFPSGNIDLRYGISAHASSEKRKQKECKDFCLTTDHRTYHFRADSASSAREWVQTLQKTIFRSHNDGDSVKISLPVQNIIDFEESPVVEFAETIKFRVLESEDAYAVGAVDEYFFSFFSFGQDALQNFRTLFPEGDGARTSDELLSGTRKDVSTFSPQGRLNMRNVSPRRTPDNEPTKSSPALQENVRATLLAHPALRSRDISPRMSGEFSHGNSPSRSSGEYGRGSFERGRRSGSTSRLEGNISRRRPDSSFAHHHDSEDSYVHSIDKETDSSTAPLSPRAEAQMSASQILDRSDLFHPPIIQRMTTLASMSSEANSEGGTVLSRSHPNDAASPIPVRGAGTHWKNKHSISQEEGVAHTNTPPTLQDFVRAGSSRLQRAGQLAGFLKNPSKSVLKYLPTEPMSYIEKVSDMWTGDRKHYGDNEGVVPGDKGIDPEDEEANVGHGDRFRAHFALPPTEKLRATYFAFLHRVLPLYGKIYISNRKFCFRSLLPGTRTKLVLPLKDIENATKEKGFRFGYHGLVLVIRGYEELFFEFNSSDHRDDCTVTLLRSLESVRDMEESGMLAKEEEDDAEAAKEEHRMLQEARRSSTGDHQLALPDTAEAIYSHEDARPVLFEGPRASISSSKPTTPLKITCLTIGSRGDVQPYIALCKALLAEGHKPRIATHAEFGPWVLKHGIDFAPVEGDPAELMRICVENGMFTYSFLREASAKFRSWIDELLSSAWQACQDSDLLIESPSAMAGLHIAEALKIPYFRAFTMPWTRTRAYPHAFAVPEHKIGGAYNYYSYVMFDNVFWKAISGQVNRWRKKELGLRSTNMDKMQPNKVPFLYNFSPHVVVPPLDYPDWVRVTGYWFLDEAQTWTPPAELQRFIEKAHKDGKKLVYIGFGSIVVSDPAALTKTVVESVLKAGVRCILSKGWSDRLGDPTAVKTEVPLPADILQIKSAPHDWLFRQIDAAVHHGGAGTTGASLRAGVPTVIKPFFGDQFFFGSRVEDLGVGICMKKVNVSLFSRALWEATHSERMIVKARLLGEQIRKENGVQTAIQAIYRDLDYAKSIVAERASKQGVPADDSVPLDEGDNEESWTFIGDESDPELQRQVQDWESPIRVSVGRASLRSMQGVEPVRKSSVRL